MQVDYQPFADRMIGKYEGTYGWDKGDPGGPTKYGITCFDLAEHRGQKMTSMTDWAPIVKAMTLQEAEAIYSSKYATAIMFDQMPPGIDCVMMDYAVNSGTGRPIRVACAMFGLPASTRMTTPLLQAIQKADSKWFINGMCDERLHFMHQIRGGSAWAQFGNGWGARVADLRQYSLHLAANTVTQAAPAPDLSNVPTPKVTHEVPDVSAKHVTTTGGGAAATGAAAQQAGLSWYIVAGLVVLVIVAGVVYVIYRQQSAIKANATVVLPPTVIPQKV